MSRRHHRRQSTDSLELLLDTICNTFGGVLFIALLVTILLQMAGGSISSSQSTTMSLEEIESLVREQDDLLWEISRFQENQQSNEMLESRLAPTEIRNMINERNKWRNKLVDTENQIQTLLAENAKTAGQIQQELRELSDIKVALPQQQQRLSALVNAIEQEIKKRSSELRLSQVRPTFGKSEVALILRYGRVYLWHRYDNLGNRQGLNVDDFIVLDSDSKSMTVRPNPLRGIPLDGSQLAKDAVSNLLAPFSPSRHTIVIVVRPDTYHAFPTVRDGVVANGFDYRLFVMSEDGTVADRGGRGGPVQ